MKDRRLSEVTTALVEYLTAEPHCFTTPLGWLVASNALLFKLDTLVSAYEREFGEPVRACISELISNWRSNEHS